MRGASDTPMSQRARWALEQVCSGARLADLADHYHPDFVDQVNGRTYRGHEGIRASVHSYQRLLRDLRFEVVQQVTEGDSVASRFVVHGTHTGRRVRLAGIVVSRFKDGLIVEDFAVTDQVDLLRQLGWWRTLFLMIRRRRSRR